MSAHNEPKVPLSAEFESQLRAAYCGAGQDHADNGRMAIGRADFVEAVVLYLYDFTKQHFHETERDSLATVADQAIGHAERTRARTAKIDADHTGDHERQQRPSE